MHSEASYESELHRSMPDNTGHLAIYISEEKCHIACCSRSFFLTRLAAYKKNKGQYPHEFIQQVFAYHQDLFARNFQSTGIGIHTKNFTLLPAQSEISDEEAIHFLTQSPTRQPYTNLIPTADAKTVFSLPVHLVEVIQQNFNEFKLFHCSKFAIENCFTSGNVFIHIETNYFDCVIRKNDQLFSATRHNYSENNDLLYFLLLAIKDADLKPEETTVHATGSMVRHDELYSFLEEYFAGITIQPIAGNIRFQSDFEEKIEAYQYIVNLLNENY